VQQEPISVRQIIVWVGSNATSKWEWPALRDWIKRRGRNKHVSKRSLLLRLLSRCNHRLRGLLPVGVSSGNLFNSSGFRHLVSAQEVIENVTWAGKPHKKPVEVAATGFVTFYPPPPNHFKQWEETTASWPPCHGNRVN